VCVLHFFSENGEKYYVKFARLYIRFSSFWRGYTANLGENMVIFFSSYYVCDELHLEKKNKIYLFLIN
jgi:hypothetical protein